MGITLVLVTHDINEAVMMADRALVMKANPGRFSAEVAIPIEGDRAPSSPEFATAKAALVEAYEGAAGLTMAETAAPDRLAPATDPAPARVRAIK